ncbi:MAG: spore photoproduct lyase family protein, partial [Verrucomicrobiales bacterium]
NAVLPTPPGYSIGHSGNFYFSHILNCLYDCRYCFLQGMYRSANYVHFVNDERFEAGIDESRCNDGRSTCFFSGYDCDSLAMEGITGFAEHFIPFFSSRPDAILELRTKSINTRVLEHSDPVANIVVAYTMTPDVIAREIEHGAPSFEMRLKRLQTLSRQGWSVGLRLDPLIPWPGFKGIYTEMVTRILETVDPSKIHSVTMGPMRFPKAMYERILHLFPRDPLFALQEMELRNKQMTYDPGTEREMIEHILSAFRNSLPEEKLFIQNVHPLSASL